MALAHGYALPFVTQKVVGDYASDNAAATARAIASGATKEAAGSCLDARAIDLQMRVPQRTDTNLLTNSAMAGATGSVLPTKWVSGSVSGLTVTISSAFTSAGFQAIDWTVSGTAIEDGTLYIGCEPNDNTNAIPASVGQQYIGAMSLGKQAGTIPATMVMQVLGQKSSDGSVIETANNTTELATLTSGSLTRINTAVLSIASVSSDRVNFRLTADVAALDVISFTIRIAAPQVERNDRISPYITTTTGAASRVTGQPSLLIVPQLTRAGVVYPQLPVVSGADFTFTRNTTATRVNASGLIESVASGRLRIDYPVTGGCPAALIEPSAQNLCLQSEGFDNASWSKTDITVTTGSTSAFTAPDGTTNADLFTSTASGSSFLAQTITIASGAATFSVFAKAGNHGIFRIGNVSSAARAAWFDLNAGAVIGTVNGGTASIQNYGSGWYRCIFTASSVVSGGSTFIIAISDAANGTASVSGATMYAWGAQLETGSIPTSYIPTTTASASRSADVCTVSGVSGYIGQTEGTLYAEVDYQNLLTTDQSIAQLFQDSNNRFGLATFRTGSDNRLQFYCLTGGSVTVNISTLRTAGVYKLAGAYANNDWVFYVNGTQIGTDTSSAVPTASTIQLGSTAAGTFQFNNRLRAAAIYTTRLDNATLANLTRLT